MTSTKTLKRQFRVNRQFSVQFISIIVAAHGIFILANTLLDQLAVRHGSRLSDIEIDLPLLIGLSLVYLSTRLRRHKYTAWLVTIASYAFYLGLNLEELLRHHNMHDLIGQEIIRRILLPLAILGLLLAFRRQFSVKSDIEGFRWALRLGLVMLVVAVVYGTAGFLLLDKSDFHQEIRPTGAIHYTVDQFNLTTVHPLHPYTKRAHLFVDSLSFVSTAAIVYAVFSLFQPLRSRLTDQTANRERLANLLAKQGAPSEDFFKLWPHDKQYFFDESGRSALAFHVYRGVALCLGDPTGEARYFGHLLNSFSELCFNNDWLLALIHVGGKNRKLYEEHDFSLQKIGQEAVLDLDNFEQSVVNNKYFRHIRNKFSKQGFGCELLVPPHDEAVARRLKMITSEWLSRGGHDERRFVMGYYSPEYIQQCRIMVARDETGTIQAFINQVPADFDKTEANFDMLRHTNSGPGNINDYLLINFISQLRHDGYKRLNMGLCPLVGLDEVDEERRGLIDNVLRFAYANGDRFYSFSGLHRFKAKYQPDWRDRYIAYRGGLRGFSRTTTALMRTMRVKS